MEVGAQSGTLNLRMKTRQCISMAECRFICDESMTEVLHLLESPKALKSKVVEAMILLSKFEEAKEDNKIRNFFSNVFNHLHSLQFMKLHFLLSISLLYSTLSVIS